MTVFTIFLAGVHTYFPQGWDVLQDILLPGNPDVTRQAFDLLVENLRNGLPFTEAAQAFCAEIIAHANIP